MRGPRSGLVRTGAIAAALGALVTVFAVVPKVPTVVAVAFTASLGIAVVGGATYLLTRHIDDADARWMHRLVALTAAGHVCIGAVINSSSGLVERFGGDAEAYHQGGIAIALHWLRGFPLPTSIGVGKEGFYYMIAAFYWLLGPQRLAVVVLNVLVATTVVPVTADTARRLFGSSVYRPAALLVAITPGYLVWSSQLLKEGPILVCLAVALNLAVRLSERTDLKLGAGLVATLTVLFTLRATVAALALVGLLVALAFTRRDAIAGLVTSAAAIVAVVAVIFVAGIGLAGFKFITSVNLQQIAVVRSDLAKSADSGFAKDADLTTIPGVLRFLPIGVTNLALGPFPWQATNVRQLGGTVDAAILWFFLPSLWRGWRASRAKIGRKRYVLAAPAVFMTIALGLLLGNYGTIVRERLQITVLLVPLVALGWVTRTRRFAVPSFNRRASTPSVEVS